MFILYAQQCHYYGKSKSSLSLETNSILCATIAKILNLFENLMNQKINVRKYKIFFPYATSRDEVYESYNLFNIKEGHLDTLVL